MSRARHSIAVSLGLFIAARRGHPFTSTDARAALPKANWSSLRARLHWMGRTGRLKASRVPGQKARLYRSIPDA